MENNNNINLPTSHVILFEEVFFKEILQILIKLTDEFEQKCNNLPDVKLQVFFVKRIILHSATILHSFQGIPFNEYSKSDSWVSPVFDLFSALGVLRAQLECFLLYNFLFHHANTKEYGDFLILNYKYNGLKELKRFSDDPVHVKGIEAQILRHKTEITNSVHFKKLNKLEQKNIIQGKSNERMGKTWKELINIAGLEIKRFCNAYSIFSEFSHTGFLSMKEFVPAVIGTQDNPHVLIILNYSKSLQSLTIEKLVVNCPECKKLYDLEPPIIIGMVEEMNSISKNKDL
ncbi:MAG: DUF5677 domain-containing protein, partial [Bacteroidales bacterium]|nr:DUF5677 domain-containing protein [Bacteroidales bacterium]